MAAALAFCAFVAAAVIFGLRALLEADAEVEVTWGFFCLAVGLALLAWSGAAQAVRARGSA